MKRNTILIALAAIGIGAYFFTKAKKMVANLSYKINLAGTRINIPATIQSKLKQLYLTVSLDLNNQEPTAIDVEGLEFAVYSEQIKIGTIVVKNPFTIEASKKTNINLNTKIELANLPATFKQVLMNYINGGKITLKLVGNLYTKIGSLPINEDINLA